MENQKPADHPSTLEQFGIAYSLPSAPYTCTLAQRQASGGLGVHDNGGDASKKDCNPGLGLHNAFCPN